jgi:hypothetical protein
MPMKICFYVLMLLWLLFGVGGGLMAFGPYSHGIGLASSLLQFLLFGLLGWKVFGRPVEG